MGMVNKIIDIVILNDNRYISSFASSIAKHFFASQGQHATIYETNLIDINLINLIASNDVILIIEPAYIANINGALKLLEPLLPKTALITFTYLPIHKLNPFFIKESLSIINITDDHGSVILLEQALSKALNVF